MTINDKNRESGDYKDVYKRQVVVLDFTKPYAVYAKSGKKVEDPYAVKAGGEELFLVKDEKTAEKVIEEVLNEYTPEGAQVVSVSVDKKLSTEDKRLKRSGEPPAVLTEKEAVNYILCLLYTSRCV